MRCRLTLVWLLLGSFLGAQPVPTSLQSEVTPPAGTYAAPVSVAVSAPTGASVSYRFLETSSTQTFAFNRLVLDALAGETRVYTLRLTTVAVTGETMTRDYRYEVRRPPEPQPTIRPVPGVYTAGLKLSPILPPDWTLQVNGRTVDDVPALETPVGSRATFLVSAQGPRGQVVDWNYTVDRRDQEVASLDVLSPIAGSWENQQALVVAFQGVDRVVWSSGSDLDPALAQPYQGPELLKGTGTQTITVGARSRADGTWLKRTVTWTNRAAAAPHAQWPGSGVKLGGIDLPELTGASLSWDEGRSWQPSQVVHREAPSAVSRKVLAVQVRQGGLVQRYVWWLDSRAPEAPVLQFVGGWNPVLAVSGSSEALYRARWTMADGKTVDEPAPLWGPVGLWKVPDGVVGAQVVVQGSSGVAGPPATIGFPQTGWSVPRWEPWDSHGPQILVGPLPLGGRIVPRDGFRVAYEVSDKPDVPEPSAASAWLSGAFLPAVPWGADRTLYARFAWRDASGLVGPATPAVAVRVDRVPPLSPEVRESGGQVLVKPAEGEEEGTDLFWAVTTSRAENPSLLTFQPYQSALSLESLRSASAGRLWFHAQAQDRAGNLGPARLNLALTPAQAEETAALVQVDSDPSVGESAVDDGGVYPWPQFRLRALGGRDLWVGVTEGTTGVPQDWKTRVQPWVGVLSRAVARGERRTFLVYWNAKTADGWAWSQPKTVTLTLDQGAPAEPQLAGNWPSAPLSAAWTLTLKPGRLGDTLRYTATTDGSTPGDPAQGDLWPGTRTWDTPAGTRAEVKLRVAAVSVAGLAVEMPRLATVIVDKSVPSAVAPELEPFSYRSGPFVVPAPAGGTVRFTLTSDGSLPEVPSATSPALLPTGLPLLGADGQSVLYRFRWRPFSAAGLPGPVSEAYSVLVDRTVSPMRAASAESARAVLPHLTGFPATGVSSSPVVLKAEANEQLHFEVGEGLSAARAVTAASPPWTGSLELDGGPGVDRVFDVALRAFSPSGQPLTDEVHYNLRIDRSLPAAPPTILSADPRRAEAVLSLPAEGRNPDESLYYRWFWDSFPQGHGEIAWQAAGAVAPRFAAPEGAPTKLRVQSFFRDEAGNEGPITEQNLLVDQNVVYVSVKGTGDGSRGQPVGSVADAVDLARRSGRTVLLVATGTYPLDRTLDLGGLRVYGGLATDVWEGTPAPSRSVLAATTTFAGTSLIESGDRDWLINRVDLNAASLSRVVVVRGADVTVQASAWTWSLSGGGWDQVGGSLRWDDVAVSYAAQPRADFLDLKQAQATIRGLNLSATQNQNGLLFAFSDAQVLLQDVAVVSKKGVDYDGIVSATGSKLTVNHLRLLAGEGASRSSAFVLKDTDATLFNAEISLFATSANTGFQTTGGRLELQRSSLSLLRGSEFNQGLTADGSLTLIQNLQLKIEAGSYQGGFSVDGGELQVASARIQLAGGGQRGWGAQFLSPALVHFDDVTWVLTTKTPGDLWRIDSPWKPGSAVTDSVVQGW